jgi:predicted permease
MPIAIGRCGLALGKHVGDLARDLTYAVRVLRRAPGFAAASVAALALGIGGSTALFTLVNGVLLRPLPFPDADRLAMIRLTSGARLSPGYLREWRLRSRGLEDIAGWRDVRANLADREQPLEVLVDQTTANFFATLGTLPWLGGTFTVGADLATVEREAVLSHRFWQQRYGGDRRILGGTIALDGEPHTIIGVMPPGFTIRTNELAQSRAELWTPFPLRAGSLVGMGGDLNVVARLREGVTIEQAQSDLAIVARAIEEEYPSYSREWGVRVLPLLEATVRDVRPALLMLFGAGGMLLLLACANVASLALSQASARQEELAVRASLGATGARLVRQLLTEHLVLAAAGGAAGVLLAIWATRVAVPVLPAGLDLPRTHEIRIDLRVLAFAVFATGLTAVLFGTLPAVGATRSTARARLPNIARSSTPGRGRNRATAAFVVSEVALAVVLLAGAGLLGRTFRALIAVHPGFLPDHVLTLRTTLPASRYGTDDRVRAFGTAVLERIRALPGITAAGTVSYLPLSGVGMAQRFEIAGRPERRLEDQKSSWVSVVGGRYFETMGIPLLRGRLPEAGDSERNVFVVDELLARRYWHDGRALGARLVWRRGERPPLVGEIVGVVGSVRWQGIAADPTPTVYWWFPHAPDPEITIVARTAGPPADMAQAVSAQVREIDPRQPVSDVRPMADLVAADLARARFTLLILGGFAAAAVAIAAIGVYGVVASAVTRRKREIGVRVALGAQRRDVIRLVMRRGMILVGTGLIVGIAAALASGRFVSGLLYGIGPRDPVTLAGVAALLAAVAAAAIYVPARRATRVDPIDALRAE